MQLGKDYPTTHLLAMAYRMAIKKLTGERLYSPDKYQPADAMVCSEVVAASYNKFSTPTLNLDFAPDVSDKYTPPGLIATSRITRELGVIRLERNES